MSEELPAAPGALLGYTTRGRPIRVIAGAAEDDPVGDGTDAPSDGRDTTNPPGGETNDSTGAGGEMAPGGPADPTNSGQDVESLPEWARERLRTQEAELRRARGDATKARLTAKQAAAEEARRQLAQDIGRAIGLVTNEDDAPDPAKLTERLKAEQREKREAKIETVILRRAAALGGDPARLLDSRRFADILANHVDTEPSDSNFGSQVEAAIKSAITEHPEEYTAVSQAPTTSGPDFSGGTGAPPVQLDDIDDLRRRRRERRSS